VGLYRNDLTQGSSSVKVAARDSLLSRAQVQEVYAEITQHYPHIVFDPIWVQTFGDRELSTSLRTLDKTDFFTREIDELQLSYACRISVHSAKDLPDPLPAGLRLSALTRGVDSGDTLVLRENETLETLPLHARVGTSSQRRESAVLALRPDLRCVDIRGPIDQRLAQLDCRQLDGLVVAEAALIRLGWTHRNRLRLPGETALWQGRLAVLAREEDEQMQQLFACIDTR
jgi:hydroxymethylbilane synthase